MTAPIDALTCREVADFLGDYVAGELDETVRAVFEGHLAECPECVAYLRSYRQTIERARDAFRDDALVADVPEQLARAILAARKSASGPGKR